MTTLDKHPPLDPRRWSTNKRIKPLGENLFGTAVKVAEGAKTVRPGDPNTTSANFQPAGETVDQLNARLNSEAAAARAAGRAKESSFLSEARDKLLKRGWATQNEQQALELLRKRQQRDI